MSINNATYLKYVYTGFTIGTSAVQQLSVSDNFVYDLVVGVNADSASASTGNWVGNTSSVTTTNKDGVKIIATTPFSIGGYAVGTKMLPVNLKNYYVAGTSGDKIYVAYLTESPREL